MSYTAHLETLLFIETFLIAGLLLLVVWLWYRLTEKTWWADFWQAQSQLMTDKLQSWEVSEPEFPPPDSEPWR